MLAVDQTGMARSLTQTQESFQHLDLRPAHTVGVDLVQKIGAVVIPYLVVDLPLRGLQLAEYCLLRFLGELASHLLLCAAQNERTQHLSEKPGAFGTGASRGCCQCFERSPAAQHPGIQEL